MHPDPNPGRDQWPPPADPSPTADADRQADDVGDDHDDGPEPGKVVKVTHHDVSTGQDVERFGTVVEVVELPGGFDPATGQQLPDQRAVRVAWLAEVTDPIPLEDTSGRADACRVEVVES